jgi:hypothetical protein
MTRLVFFSSWGASPPDPPEQVQGPEAFVWMVPPWPAGSAEALDKKEDRESLPIKPTAIGPMYAQIYPLRRARFTTSSHSKLRDNVAALLSVPVPRI